MLSVRSGSDVGTVKMLALVDVDPFRETVIGPVVAPVGTAVVIIVWELATNEAGAPSKSTEVTPMKSEPRICTCVPGTPDVGEKELIEGCGGAADAPGALINAAAMTIAGTRATSLVVLLGRIRLLLRRIMDASEGNGCYQGHRASSSPQAPPGPTR
jgi:hypothetical protein